MSGYQSWFSQLQSYGYAGFPPFVPGEKSQIGRSSFAVFLLQFLRARSRYQNEAFPIGRLMRLHSVFGPRKDFENEVAVECYDCRHCGRACDRQPLSDVSKSELAGRRTTRTKVTSYIRTTFWTHIQSGAFNLTSW